jgi:hypothetical protein
MQSSLSPKRSTSVGRRRSSGKIPGTRRFNTGVKRRQEWWTAMRGVGSRLKQLAKGSMAHAQHLPTLATPMVTCSQPQSSLVWSNFHLSFPTNLIASSNVYRTEPVEH